jgi:hypothetical protein
MMIFLLACSIQDNVPTKVEVPDNSNWSSIPTPPLEGRKDFVFLNDKDSIFIWGGDGINGSFDDGAIYSIKSKEWQSIPTSPMGKRTDFFDYSGDVFNGKFWLFGGRRITGNYWSDSGNAIVYSDIHTFDSNSNSWEHISTTNSPSKRAYAKGIYYKDNLFLFGGNAEPVDPSFSNLDANNDGLYDKNSPAQFEQYSMSNSNWQFISLENTPTQRKHGLVTLHNEAIIVWGGGYEHQMVDTDIHVFSIVENKWTRIDKTDKTPSPREYFSSVYCSDKYFVWGGVIVSEDGVHPRGDGAILDPETLTWKPISDDGPSPRVFATAICTGEQVILWGGFAFNGQQLENNALSDGAIYDLKSEQWTTIPTNPNIPPRGHHRALWTGTQMLIFGGTDKLFTSSAKYFNDGWVYTPGKE